MGLWLGHNLALLGAITSCLASQNELTVFNFKADGAEGVEDYVEFRLDNTQITAFSICFYFKPTFQLNRNVQILLKFPSFITVGIYEDSVGGWLKIGAENIIFDFPSALYPRTWNSFCIQQTSSERKIWHENQTIYEENLNEDINFNIKVCQVFQVERGELFALCQSKAMRWCNCWVGCAACLINHSQIKSSPVFTLIKLKEFPPFKFILILFPGAWIDQIKWIFWRFCRTSNTSNRCL